MNRLFISFTKYTFALFSREKGANLFPCSSRCVFISTKQDGEEAIQKTVIYNNKYNIQISTACKDK